MFTNPPHDIICSLLQVPFAQRTEKEKRDILKIGRPTPTLYWFQPEKRHGEMCSRTFRTSWYQTYDWLCGSSLLGKLYCWPCLLTGRSSRKTWTKEGYFDLKNLSRNTLFHHNSREHIENYVVLKRSLQTSRSNIYFVPSKEDQKNKYNALVRRNRALFKKLVDTAVILCKQQLPFVRYGREEGQMNAGNFEEIFNCLVLRHSADLKEHWEELKRTTSTTSVTIQKEIVECLQEELFEFTYKEINSVPFFSVQVDEVTDLTEKAQCTVIVRYVNSNGDTRERFFGLHEIVGDKTSTVFHNIVQSVLHDFNCEQKLIAQCCDGTSLSSSELSELDSKFIQQAPYAMNTHSYTHQLENILQHRCNSIEGVRLFFATLESMCSFFDTSEQRGIMLNEMCEKYAPSVIKICRTTKLKVLHAIVHQIRELIDVLKTIQEDSRSASKTIHQANSFISSLKLCDFVFLAFLFHAVFNITCGFDDILQKINFVSQQFLTLVQKALVDVKKLRCDEKFCSIYQEAKNNIAVSGEEIQCEPSDSKYREIFHHVLNNIDCELERFKRADKLEFLELSDTAKFKYFTSNFPSNAFDSLIKSYGILFDIPRLRNELEVFYTDDMLYGMPLNSVVKSIIFNDFKSVFGQVYKLFSLCLTLPVSVIPSTEEMSCYHRVQTYLRIVAPLSRGIASASLGTLCVETQLLTSLAERDRWYEDIINRYAATKKDSNIDLIFRN